MKEDGKLCVWGYTWRHEFLKVTHFLQFHYTPTVYHVCETMLTES